MGFQIDPQPRRIGFGRALNISAHGVKIEPLIAVSLFRIRRHCTSILTGKDMHQFVFDQSIADITAIDCGK